MELPGCPAQGQRTVVRRPCTGERPHCHSPTITCKRCGGGDRTRTCDILLAKQELYQLSYAPMFRLRGRGGPMWTRTTDLTLIRRTL